MKKKFALTGLISGCVLILIGILVFAGAFGGDFSSAYSSYRYDSGYATFGADFYTYVSNNAAEAAEACRAAANNTREMGKVLKASCGSLLTFFGIFMLCTFGIKLGEFKEEEARLAAAPADAPAEVPAAPALDAAPAEKKPEEASGE